MVTHIKFYFWIGKELIGRKEIVRWSVAGWDQRDFLRSISITFHNLGNIADGKLSKFSLKTRSNLYDFVLFRSARDLAIFRKEERRLSLKYSCINVRTLSLYVSSRLRTFSFENNGFECVLKVLLFTGLIVFFCKDLIFAVYSFYSLPK